MPGAALFEGDGGAVRGDLLVGLDADEGVAAYMLAALDGLKQEGLRLRLAVGLLRDAQEGGDRVSRSAVRVLYRLSRAALGLARAVQGRHPLFPGREPG